MHSSLHWLKGALARLDLQSLRRRRTVRESCQAAEVAIDGQRMVNFGANDYLGLAADPRLAEAAARVLGSDGSGSGASPIVSGRSRVHAELERRLAEFEHTESALVFPSGFAANAGIIPALVGEGDAVLSDAVNHASLIDGCRLSKAERFIYPHCDVAALERLLIETSHCRRRLIVTDSLFSMDGDVAPLVEIGQLADRYNAMLLVDEAHATGVWGAEGRGLVEHFSATAPQLEQQATIRVGTLSKALGACGGFVVGPNELIEWLANSARSYVFSTAGMAASAAAAIAALDIVRDEPFRRTELLTHAAMLREQLVERGWDIADSTSQVIPVVVGDADKTLALAGKLREAGLYVPAIRPPTVAEDSSRLRISLSWLHTEEQVGRLVEALGKNPIGRGVSS
ncbi:8-amino-7-oxononanoate synthase [Aeoliella sp. SH292]|uniref:8-amino-7-oxononanoate synthase n=1 Tax=Aeoliella sp. SH292 TaxID=3454464 RepID=UPI003F9B73A1